MIAVLLVGISASCTKDFQKINATWNGSASATFSQMYQSIGSNLDLTAQGEDNAGTRWLYPITQQGAVYAASDYGYGGGANWNGFYQNLAAENQMLSVIAANPDSANYTNAKAMLKVLRAYQAIELSNFYGDIPYFKAGKGLSGSTTDLNVPYDKQQAIYLSCLKDLTWAVNNFNSSSSSQFSFGSSEFLLANNIPQWVKFANSLRLRYALTMYDKDNQDAGPIIADALNKPLLTDPIDDVVGLSPANIPGLGFDYNAAGRGFSFRQECRIRMGSVMWNLMSNNNNTDGSGIFDPRCKIFFEVNGNGAWAPYPQNPVTAIVDGGDPYNTGRDNDWSSYKTGNLYSDFNYYWGRDGVAPGSTGTVPEIFMTPAEVHFLKAEVYARGIAGVAQNMTTAQTEYEAGITSSLTFWMTMAYTDPIWAVNKPASGTPGNTDLSAVLTNPKVAFDASNAVKLIYAQEWIDLFRQPWVAWTLMRRTGGATPADPNNPAGYAQNYGSLQRYQYPGDEQLYNNVNWKAETGGNDVTSTKIWVAK
ncbi:MAG TPA: SusD/RagB family nutrient-binding outer membrane lipoprotein [Mucilaginibacter sp.]|nr:SusD/RagB family nutrient-binding outer membrane lipoprotein [Mucilaginibacter sp.]